ncbi:hypothetical protein FYK55_01670 [Roseiconus nitratireducens]|uniref:Lytic murein transglycosylase n=1 Tax=Roseiconus nitratireducens TaxID=2605748 RepID=A0A5M6DHW4_9BACT|nr:hypothetical protein [Roseiconus nitratireducens]KAA5547147.1 hypothetical protein FYK55_01670 [Roseiconus nitratireducens]
MHSKFASVSILSLTLLAVLATESPVAAQITAPQILSAVPSQQASLDEFLINRLRATTAGQQSYVREVVKLVDEKKLERRLVLAMERYARRKSPYFPLPVFERAMRYQGAKQGVTVPMIKEIVARDGETAARAVSDSRIR